jgi:hypothetical protein
LPSHRRVEFATLGARILGRAHGDDARLAALGVRLNFVRAADLAEAIVALDATHDGLSLGVVPRVRNVAAIMGDGVRHDVHVVAVAHQRESTRAHLLGKALAYSAHAVLAVLASILRGEPEHPMAHRLGDGRPQSRYRVHARGEAGRVSARNGATEVHNLRANFAGLVAHLEQIARQPAEVGSLRYIRNHDSVAP